MTMPADGQPEPRSRRAFLKRCGIAAGVAAGLGLGVGCRRKEAEKKEDAASPFGDLIAFIEGEIKLKSVPGAGVVVSQHGKTVLDRAFGTYCGYEKRDLPFDTAIPLPLYSISKTITSTVVVMAKQDGLIDYDAPVSRYIPEFKGGGRDEVTVRHCLTLSSGIPSVPLGSLATEDKWQAALKRVCESEPRWKPGSQSEYHNIVGHFLAGECVRRRSGMKPWNAICKERLFDPLGAASLAFEMPPETQPFTLTPQPSSLPSKVPGFEDFSPGHPGGGCIGTIGDILKVMNLHLQGGKWNGKQLIEPAVFKEMHTVQFAKQIAEAHKAGIKPAYKSWGLGIFLRGEGLDDPRYRDYGFGGSNSPSMFGQNGITTIVTVADPSLDAAFVFATTDSPKGKDKAEDKAAELWTGVSRRVFEAVKA